MSPFLSLLNSNVSKRMRPTVARLFYSAFIPMHSSVPFQWFPYSPSRNVNRSILSSLKSFSKDYMSTASDINPLPILPVLNHTHNSLLLIVPEHTADPAPDQVIYSDRTIFGSLLKELISSAQNLRKSSIWVQVPISRSSLIEELHPLGFEFHHTQGSMAHLFLWLDKKIPCKIPEYATHQVGVGAVVINNKDEILCVRELRNNYRPWKIPGGLTELGEHLSDAAVREVLEETGVRCTFISVLGVRHTHNVQFGRSDLYFVCRLKPVEGEEQYSIEKPIAQEGEIEAVAWVPLEEYKAMVYSEDQKQGHPMMKCIMDIVEQSHGKFDIQTSIVPSVVPGRLPSPIYHAPIRRSQSQGEH